MMKLNQKSIACDLCRLILSDNFEYYSLDLRKVCVVDSNIGSTKSIMLQKIDHSMDVCSLCFKRFETDIVVYYDKFVKGRKRPMVYCEISGEPVSNGTIYRCNAAKVVVNIPNVHVDREYLEFNINDKECHNWLAKMEDTKMYFNEVKNDK